MILANADFLFRFAFPVKVVEKGKSFFCSCLLNNGVNVSCIWAIWRPRSHREAKVNFPALGPWIFKGI